MKTIPFITFTICIMSTFSCADPTGSASADSPRPGDVVLFEETFEDTDWESRGWYDGPHMEITDAEHIPDSGHSCVWHWRKAGDISPSGGAARVRLTPVETATVSFWIKHSENWTWTGVPYHPHEFHFLTTEDDYFIGPAYTHLTFYFEVVNGVPRIAIQDSKNIDESKIGKNLVGVTENRSVAGGNGDSDGYGDGDIYRAGSTHRNGKFWEADSVYFGNERGPRYKGDWHHVAARVMLNSVRDGIGQRDGELQFWFDGKLIIDHRDVVFRTGQHPEMRINQFMMAPYYGPGVSHEQKIWIDNLKVTTDGGT